MRDVLDLDIDFAWYTLRLSHISPYNDDSLLYCLSIIVLIMIYLFIYLCINLFNYICIYLFCYLFIYLAVEEGLDQTPINSWRHTLINSWPRALSTHASSLFIGLHPKSFYIFIYIYKIINEPQSISYRATCLINRIIFRKKIYYVKQQLNS